MGQGRIATLGQDHKIVLESMKKDGPFCVWEFGSNVQLSLEMQKGLPANAIYGELSDRLDLIADGIARPLLDLDEQVLSGEEDRLSWSASIIGDRSSYSGDLQLNATRYLVIHDIICDGGRHLFFVDNDEIRQAFEQTAVKNKLHILYQKKPTSSITQGLNTLRARLSALKTQWAQSRIIKRKRLKRPPPWEELAKCDVIILDWASAGCFNSDSYTQSFGNVARMPNILRDAGMKVGFIANPLSWIEPYEGIAETVAKASDPVVMLDECRGLVSVIKAAWATWRMNCRLKSVFHIIGLNLSPVFELERRMDKGRTQSVLAYTYSEIARTLVMKGVKPKAIIFPFENHGWERALLAGARRHLSQTRMIAYQHAPFAARHIGFFPSQSDLNSGRTVDKLIVMGKRFEDLFTRFGWSAEKLALGGSLRFENSDIIISNRKRKTEKVLLIATSIGLSEALDLVVKAATVIRTNQDWRLVVNFHPIVDDDFRQTVSEALEVLMGETGMGRAVLSNEKVSNLISEADVLLYNNSGAVFDAFFAGVPAVHVAIDGNLSYDKVPDGAAVRVRNVAELESVLTRIVSCEQNQKPDRTVGGCISKPVDEVIVKAVIGE